MASGSCLVASKFIWVLFLAALLKSGPRVPPFLGVSMETTLGASDLRLKPGPRKAVCSHPWLDIPMTVGRTCRAAGQLLLLLAAVASLSCTTPRSFAASGTDSLKSLRKRDGLALHTKASHKGSVLSKAGKELLKQLGVAREAGDWMKARSLFAGYAGTEIQVFNSVLHTACDCVQYKAGAKIYGDLCNQGIAKTSATYSAALKIFAKMGDNKTVRDIWQEAKSNPMCEVNEPLAAARIDAAAEEGDVQSALLVLDDMFQKNISVNIAHITSAIRACWTAGGVSYKTADRLFSLSLSLGLEPNIVTFACLAGAYVTAPLARPLTLYADMKNRSICPNEAFADAYLASVLQKPKADSWPRKQLLVELRKLQGRCPARIKAARSALANFKGLGVDLFDFAQRVDAAIRKLS